MLSLYTYASMDRLAPAISLYFHELNCFVHTRRSDYIARLHVVNTCLLLYYWLSFYYCLNYLFQITQLEFNNIN